MTVSSKLSMLAFAVSASLSNAAFATGNVWDSADPWGTATLTENAEWQNFISYPAINGPDKASTGDAASLTETTGSAFIVGGSNIYSFAAPTNFIATLANNYSGSFDVYLRIATTGNLALSTATLNGVTATTVVAYTASSGSAFGGAEQEQYWKWSNVSGASSFTFNFGASDASMSLDQLQLTTVAVAAPVPEADTSAMLLAGLGLMGVLARRRMISPV